MQKDGRIYELNKKQIVIPQKVIKTFFEWNTSEEKANNQVYDERVTIALLLVCVDMADLISNTVPKYVKDFIESKYQNSFLKH